MVNESLKNVSNRKSSIRKQLKLVKNKFSEFKIVLKNLI